MNNNHINIDLEISGILDKLSKETTSYLYVRAGDLDKDESDYFLKGGGQKDGMIIALLAAMRKQKELKDILMSTIAVLININKNEKEVFNKLVEELGLNLCECSQEVQFEKLDNKMEEL